MHKYDRHTRPLERAGIMVIGVFLGDDADPMVELKRLFPCLIISSNNGSPDNPENYFKSLVRKRKKGGH